MYLSACVGVGMGVSVGACVWADHARARTNEGPGGAELDSVLSQHRRGRCKLQ